jgi:hypothetical protein
MTLLRYLTGTSFKSCQYCLFKKNPLLNSYVNRRTVTRARLELQDAGTRDFWNAGHCEQACKVNVYELERENGRPSRFPDRIRYDDYLGRVVPYSLAWSMGRNIWTDFENLGIEIVIQDEIKPGRKCF